MLHNTAEDSSIQGHACIACWRPTCRIRPKSLQPWVLIPKTVKLRYNRDIEGTWLCHYQLLCNQVSLDLSLLLLAWTVSCLLLRTFLHSKRLIDPTWRNEGEPQQAAITVWQKADLNEIMSAPSTLSAAPSSATWPAIITGTLWGGKGVRGP